MTDATPGLAPWSWNQPRTALGFDLACCSRRRARLDSFRQCRPAACLRPFQGPSTPNQTQPSPAQPETHRLRNLVLSGPHEETWGGSLPMHMHAGTACFVARPSCLCLDAVRPRRRRMAAGIGSPCRLLLQWPRRTLSPSHDDIVDVVAFEHSCCPPLALQ